MILKISDFLNNAPDDSRAVYEAVKAINDGDTLDLEGRTLNLYAEMFPEKRYYCISNNLKGDKSAAISLIGKQNVHIVGNGARLILHGTFMPFIADGCNGAELSGLSIDYADPMFLQAEIIEAREGYTLLRFDRNIVEIKEHDGYVYAASIEGLWEKELTHCCVYDFDAAKHRPDAYHSSYLMVSGSEIERGNVNPAFKQVRCEVVGKNTVAIIGDIGQVHTVGNRWVATFSNDRLNPGIFVQYSRNIVFNDITLNHSLSMGIICQCCENVSLHGITVEPGEGRELSTAADATHFVNCRGKISITHSRFFNMLDDAVNIHGVYNTLIRRVNDRTLVLGFGHYQQVGVQQYEPGDTVRILNVDDGSTVGEYTVSSGRLLSDDELELTTVEPMAAFAGAVVAENASAVPEIYISDCSSGSNRPRGFLLSSPKKTVVENCEFSNIRSGISICPGMKYWFESGQVRDVTIRNNHFNNCSYATNAPAIIINPEGNHPELLAHFQSGIRITDNTFTMHDKRFLRANGVDGLVFTGNRFCYDETMPTHGDMGDTGIELTNCFDAVIENVK